MRFVHIDGSSEFGGDFASYCEAQGITGDVQLPYQSHGNGQVEHANRSVQALLRWLLLHAPNINTLDVYVAAI